MTLHTLHGVYEAADLCKYKGSAGWIRGWKDFLSTFKLYNFAIPGIQYMMFNELKGVLLFFLIFIIFLPFLSFPHCGLLPQL